MDWRMKWGIDFQWAVGRGSRVWCCGTHASPPVYSFSLYFSLSLSLSLSLSITHTKTDTLSFSRLFKDTLSHYFSPSLCSTCHSPASQACLEA